MTRRRRKNPAAHIANPAVKEMIKIFERIEQVSGYRSQQIYDDFLDLTEATLNALPGLARAAVNKETFFDTEETQAMWRRLHDKYNFDRAYSWGKKKDVTILNLFSEAFHILLEHASTPLQAYGSTSGDGLGGPDILGTIYMVYGSPSSWGGQFFTPWGCSQLISGILSDQGRAVYRNLRQALNQSPVWDVLGFKPGDTFQDENLFAAACQFDGKGGLNYYEPIKVMDPCVGSGILLLGFAASVPHWMNQYGLIQYHGVDIDVGCVKMSRLNFKLYGINDTTWIRCALDLSEAEIAAMPAPGAQQAARMAKAAHERGDKALVEQIAGELHQANMAHLTGAVPVDVDEPTFQQVFAQEVVDMAT